MPRPKRCRRICGYPDFWSFAPEDTEADETVVLMLDEFETIRRIDAQRMTQEECAAAMEVSRATVTGIYEAARFKIADAIIHGKRIRIAGGAYRIEHPTPLRIQDKGEYVMRIAVPYEAETIEQHFGRAKQFKFYDVAEDVTEEIVDTVGEGHGALAGFLHASKVDLVICGGIGEGAQSALAEAGIRLISGVKGNADEAVRQHLAGTLVHSADGGKCAHRHQHKHGKEHGCGHGGHGGGCGSHEAHVAHEGHGGHGPRKGHGPHGGNEAR